MKTAYLSVLFMLVVTGSINAQKQMALPVELQSVPALPVDMKFKGEYYPYVFGPYRLVEGKNHWYEIKDKAVRVAEFPSFFKENKKTKEGRGAYVMQGVANQMAVVNIATTKEIEYATLKRDFLDNKKGEKVLGDVKTLLLAAYYIDTTRWDLEVAFTEDGEFTFENNFAGRITAPGRQYTIESVFKFADGKTALGGLPLGAVVRLNGTAVAAVQFYGAAFSSLKKNNFVWLAEALDEPTKLAIASSLVAIMNKAHHGLMTSDREMDR